jgi:hypothetical protein
MPGRDDSKTRPGRVHSLSIWTPTPLDVARQTTYTLQWRDREQIDTILSRPDPNYEHCQTHLPITLLNSAATGHVVLSNDRDCQVIVRRHNDVSLPDMLHGNTPLSLNTVGTFCIPIKRTIRCDYDFHY